MLSKKKDLSRRQFIGKVAKGAVVVGLAATGAEALQLLGYLQPKEEFLPEWKGSIPIRQDDGYVVLSGEKITKREVDDKSPPGGKAGFLFLWNDTYWGGMSPGLIIKDSEGEYHASSLKCTHAGCLVAWHDSYEGYRKVWWSHCHNGVFDSKDGKVLSGPPPAPLQQFAIEFEGEEKVVKLIKSPELHYK